LREQDEFLSCDFKASSDHLLVGDLGGVGAAASDIKHSRDELPLIATQIVRETVHKFAEGARPQIPRSDRTAHSGCVQDLVGMNSGRSELAELADDARDGIPHERYENRGRAGRQGVGGMGQMSEDDLGGEVGIKVRDFALRGVVVGLFADAVVVRESKKILPKLRACRFRDVKEDQMGVLLQELEFRWLVVGDGRLGSWKVCGACFTCRGVHV